MKDCYYPSSFSIQCGLVSPIYNLHLFITNNFVMGYYYLRIFRPIFSKVDKFKCLFAVVYRIPVLVFLFYTYIWLKSISYKIIPAFWGL